MLSNLYWTFRNFLFPQYRWLTKHLGRTFVAKKDVIRITLYQSLIDFWENDDGAERIRERAVDPISTNAASVDMDVFKHLYAAYEWAKTGRGVLVDEIRALETKLGALVFPQVFDPAKKEATQEQLEAIQAKLSQLEEDLRKLDNTYLGIILDYREALSS